MTSQLPGTGAIFLDHLAHFVPDMDEAHQAFNRLGFVQTPYTPHRHTEDGQDEPVLSGTANRCVMLDEGYFEIMAVSDPETPHGARTQAQIDRYTGLHLIAFATAEPEAIQGRLTFSGFHPQPLVHLTRAVTRPDGSEDTARFTCCRVRPEDMPEGRVQYVTHLTEDLVWQDRWKTHGNGITALRDVIICTDDLERTAARFCFFLDQGSPKRLYEGIWRVPLDRGGVVICDPERLGVLLPGLSIPSLPFIAGYGVLSRDLGLTAGFLRDRGFTMDEVGPTLRLILPEAIGGAMLIAGEEDGFAWSRT